MQVSFSDFEYASKKTLTRHDRFIAEIEAVTTWAKMLSAQEPFCPKGCGRGRSSIGLEGMLRMLLAQQCFGLSDEGIEDVIYNREVIQRFVGIDLAPVSAPDGRKLLKFQCLLEVQGLIKQLLETAHLAEKGLMMREGSVFDATIITAPPSTKSSAKVRDPEMQQTTTGNQLHFGMKAHISADIRAGLVQTVLGTASNVADITRANALLQGNETDVLADSGYQGVQKRDENKALVVQWHVAMRPGKHAAQGSAQSPNGGV